ncbi:hypothetical protein Rhopal_002491-T1 [Rhodotorula paludigena]|uniref:Bud22 domain-containing protein n=1 Tax=Rhodotorula paludigena TaxID=86838 RepID=A0AAV5GHX9_9BASI|nr:hypothetical protein Rhopal_002491-T1 [Rhodotorula paludigena]
MPGNPRKRASDYASKPPHTKRWKGAPAADDAPADPAQQEQAVKAYLHHAVKIVHKAVKKSKTFELQKLTRKLKSTREPKEGVADAALVADLEAQLLALKKVNLDAIPTQLLSTRLSKLPALRSTSFLPSLLSSLPSPPKFATAEVDPQSAEGKARNRVLANKAIGEAWDEVSRAVRKRLGEEVEQPGKDKGKGKEKEKKPPKGIRMDPGRQAAIEQAFLGGGAEEAEEGGEESSADEGPAEGFSDDEAGEGGSEEDEDEAIQRELAALDEGAGSEGEWSDSDDEGAASDAASDSSFPTGGANAAAKTSKRRQPSLSPSPTPAKKAKPAAPSKPITSSSFLPSLAAGYVSYSDSDGEDARWVKDAEREDKKSQRKNRRGQRARQAIWEKKFGSAANHVVKAAGGKPVPLAKMKEQKAQRAARKAGSGPPATAAASSAGPAEPRGRTFQQPQSDGGWKKRDEKKPAGGGDGAAAEKMHPSWEAKRKAAEMQKLGAVAPQGKKITFD